MSDIEEFINALGTETHLDVPTNVFGTPQVTDNSEVKKETNLGPCQWVIGADNEYWGASSTRLNLPAGMYTLEISNTRGPVFTKVDLKTDNILILPDTKNEKILLKIQKFLAAEHKYRALKQLYRRGILMWGPQGSGKSMTINLIAKEVIERYNGLVLLMPNPVLTMNCLRLLRTIEPNRLIVGILEEIDEIIRRNGEADLLSLLDGQHNTDKIVYLATTNYPDRLPPRLVNRPGRFEIEKIDMPNAAARECYIRGVLPADLLNDNDLEKWVKDTEGMSIDHVHELIITMFCLEDFQYEETIKRLKAMKNVVHVGSDNKLGFGNHNGNK